MTEDDHWTPPINVVSLDAARERRQSGAQKPVHPILEALDALALALADHGHTWTERERNLYETSVGYLTGGDVS